MVYMDEQEDSRLGWEGACTGAGQEFSIWEVGRELAICR